MLLAAAAPAGFAGDAVDLGASTGAVGLALALRALRARVRLVEIDPALAALATENAALNGLADRVRVCVADALAGRAAREAAGLADNSADLVLTNPPYLNSAASRVSPHAGRALAHVMPEGGLDGWMSAAAGLLRPGGVLIVIHRADALPALLAAAAGRFGALAALPIHPRAGEPATRVLLRGVRGSRAPFSMRAGLVLHGPDGAFTPHAEALNRGEAVLDW